MHIAIALLLSLALAGCIFDDSEDGALVGAAPADTSMPREVDARDSDNDGIVDEFERSLADECQIVGRSCAELGIVAPTVGARDYILLQYGRSGTDQNWRMSDWVWSEFAREMSAHGIALQVVDVGVRDDLEFQAEWDDYDMVGKFWLTYLGYDGEEADSAGWNEYNHIMIQRLPDVSGHELEREWRMTLLHEAYHSILGDLEQERSRCTDEETGGSGHSSAPESILFVDAACESQPILDNFQLSSAEAVELAQTPFENLMILNDPSDWA